MLLEILGTDCPVLPGVTVGVQRGRAVVDELPADGTDKRWTLELTVVDGRDVRGPYVQGRPGSRFVYLSWQRDDGMFRRAKLMLDSLASYEDQVLTVGLTMPDGSPLCAAVRPPAMSWQPAASPR
jgi:uncharacterized protein DUF5990